MVSKKTLIIFLIVLSLLIIMGCGSDTSTSAISFYSTATGTGYLRKADTLWILNLEGNYTDMGRQYGALLKDELISMFHQMDNAIGYEKNRDYVNLIGSTMDERERQFLTGMSIESGLEFSKHEFLNAALFFMYAPGGCSAFAAMGRQTESGFTIAGRNFDNPKGVDGKYVNLLRGKSILVIYNPREQFNGHAGTHRDNSAAVMTYIGWFHGLTILNSKGIYLEYNNATNSIPMIKEDLPSLLRQFKDGLHQNLYAAFDSDSLDEVHTALTGQASVANMTQVADKNHVWHYERSPYENSRKLPIGTAKGYFYYDNLPDMSIFTNHFFFADWKKQQFIYTSPENDSGSRTFARLINLQRLASGAAGKINVEIMKVVMTTHLLDNGGGGPFIGWELNNPDVTHFTTVTDIANKVMHIYPYVDGGPGQWTAVHLNMEFR